MGALKTRKLFVAADSLDIFEYLIDIARIESNIGDWRRIFHSCILEVKGYPH